MNNRVNVLVLTRVLNNVPVPPLAGVRLALGVGGHSMGGGERTMWAWISVSASIDLIDQ